MNSGCSYLFRRTRPRRGPPCVRPGDGDVSRQKSSRAPPPTTCTQKPLHPLFECAAVQPVAHPRPEGATKRVSAWVLEGDVPSPIDPPPGVQFPITRCPWSTEVCTTDEPAFGGAQPRPPGGVPPSAQRHANDAAGMGTSARRIRRAAPGTNHFPSEGTVVGLALGAMRISRRHRGLAWGPTGGGADWRARALQCWPPPNAKA